MSTTDAARESARRRDGQFGIQRLTEPDPANAGLGAPEAPPPTWEEALAHAETLRERGVDVRVGWKWIAIRGTDGELHDLADGTPAWQGFYPDGTTETIGHWTNGELHDPADGTPARRGFYPDGTPMWISHWTNGELHDPADGTPAWQGFYPDGTPEWIGYYTDGKLHDPADETPAIQEFHPDGSPECVEHWTDGELISEERFPPPIGEA